jgi:uncharacterized protein (TIGR02453 family)
VAFSGWSDAAIDFYDGLEEDNSKSYWQAHRAVYDDAVKQPMEALLADLADEFGAGKVFRPYRDVRFSPDKSPYKTAIAASVGGSGYVQLSAAGLAVGSGMWIMDPDQLQRYRGALDTDPPGAELVCLMDEARRGGLDITAHQSLKSAPRGYPKDHPRVELLRLKGLALWKQWPVAPWLATPKARGRVVDVLRRAQPVNQWLATHVGAGAG